MLLICLQWSAQKTLTCDTRWMNTQSMERLGEQMVCITIWHKHKWKHDMAENIEPNCIFSNTCMRFITQANALEVWMCAMCPVKGARSTCIRGLELGLRCRGEATWGPRGAPERIKISKVCICVGTLCSWGGVRVRFRHTDEQKQKTQWEENNGFIHIMTNGMDDRPQI